VTSAPLRLGAALTLVLAGARVSLSPAPGPCSGQDPAACDLVWIDTAGRPNSAAYDALVLLDDAVLDGLNPDDYGAAALRPRSTAIAAATALTREAVRFDADLTAAMLRFLRDLHAGRADAKAWGVPDLSEADDPDYAALLRSAATTGRLLALVDALTPAGRQYVAIRRELARYRELAFQRDWPAALSHLPRLAPGESGDVGALRAWLVATGDLRSESPDTRTTYAGAIVDAVRRFQTRHGLPADGIIGAATAHALRTPVATRIRQLELALERLRWLRALGPGRLVVINIPMFRLWAWDRPDSGTPPDLAMNAVVGRAVATETPVLLETMTHVVLGPYWNVPRSIVVNEILPLVARDGGYLDRAHMEIVEGESDDAPVVPPTPANLARLRAGTVRLRQRPGPDNAMGSIKFVFPNEHLVFIHGTSAPGIFAEPRRDLSHGCIRVEAPVALAAWALRGLDEWPADAIARTAPAVVSRQIDLLRPARVLVYYATAAVLPDDGLLHFSEDIYGRDQALDRALRRQ
jgi:murein L,D-transpeptidase YcbB/YkuD